MVHCEGDGYGVNPSATARRVDGIPELKKKSEGAVRLAILLPDGAANAELPKPGVVKSIAVNSIAARDDILLYATFESVDAVFGGVDWLGKLKAVLSGFKMLGSDLSHSGSAGGAPDAPASRPSKRLRQDLHDKATESR